MRPSHPTIERATPPSCPAVVTWCTVSPKRKTPLFPGFHGLIIALSTAPCPSTFGRRLKCGDFRANEKVVVNSQKWLETGVGSWNLELCKYGKTFIKVYAGTLLGVPPPLKEDSVEVLVPLKPICRSTATKRIRAKAQVSNPQTGEASIKQGSPFGWCGVKGVEGEAKAFQARKNLTTGL